MRFVKTLTRLGLALGLLPSILDGAPKPPPPPPKCTDCPIVYASGYSKGSLHRMDLRLVMEDGSRDTLLLADTDNVYNRNPVWSPDGSWVSFGSNRDGTGGLWVIRNDGAGLTKVVSTCDSWSTSGWRPMPSAGGYWLAFSDRRQDDGTTCGGQYDTEIWLVEVNVAALPVLAGQPVCLTCPTYFEPAIGVRGWSRDGAHIAVQTGYKEYIFDVGFGADGMPFLDAKPDETPPYPGYWELSNTGDFWELSWLRFSDAFFTSLPDATGKRDLWRIDIDLVNRRALAWTNLTAGSPYSLRWPRPSPDDQRILTDASIPGRGSWTGTAIVTPGPVLSVVPIGTFRGLHDWKR